MSAGIMRWVRFAGADGPCVGRLDASDMVTPGAGDMFGGWTPSGEPVPLSSVRLMAPVIPPTFYACGINYEGHWRTAAEEFGLDPEKSWPKYPEVGYRAQSAIIGPGDPIVLPADVPPNVQVEGELAVVIGRTARHVAAADAFEYVFGYTIGNDVSARGWQFQDRTFWRAKNSDTFKPLGPWIVTGADPEAFQTSVSVNGTVRERFRTWDMIHSVAAYIEAMTRYITLVPGDVILMGTDGHCPRLEPGDIASIEIEGIGTLSNPVEKEQAR
jgi:2-keto-4-pentenoate hydratase/2-oxohepta-3-ene-1,7-dioic acid hydratase in catechol pathway